MRGLGAGLPRGRVRLSPMPVYDGEDNQAGTPADMRKELLRGPRPSSANVCRWEEAPWYSTSLSSVPHAGANPDRGISQEVNHCDCTDLPPRKPGR